MPEGSRSKRPKPRRALALCLAALVLACAPAAQIAVAPLPEFDAAFSRRSGWIGGDGAHSVPLADGSLLWTFGDSLIGEVREGRREIAFFVHNAIALQRGKTLDASQLSFHFGRGPAGEPAAFFAGRRGGGGRWPFHGRQGREGLFLFLLEVEPAAGPPAFAFSPAGGLLAVIENPGAPPEDWRVELHEIPWGNPERRFGQAVVAEEGETLVFGTREEKGPGGPVRHLLLARAPAEALADFASWRFYDGQGWSAAVEEARPLLSGIAPEFSVSRLPGTGGWVLVASEEALSPRILLRFAPRPEGPWGEAIAVYSCPEAAADARVFCYAAKAHPALSSRPGELIVTYVANATDPGLLLSRPELYRPRFLRITLDPDPARFAGSSPETAPSLLGP